MLGGEIFSSGLPFLFQIVLWTCISIRIGKKIEPRAAIEDSRTSRDERGNL